MEKILESMKNKEAKPASADCLLCGKKAELVDARCPGFMKPDVFGIYHCPTCNTQFSLPRTDSAKIYEYMYGKGYSHYCSYPAKIRKAKDPLLFLARAEAPYRAAIDVILRMAARKDNLRILEIGSGLGYFTYALNRAGFSATGIDISENGVAQAKETFGDYYICADITRWAEDHRGEYDIVLCVETVEHVDRILPFMQSMADCCKKGAVPGEGGKIIVTTPNKSIYPEEAVWCNSLPPFHMWWLSETSMLRIAEKIRATVYFTDWSEYHRQRHSANRTTFNPKARRPQTHFLDENGLLLQPRSALYRFLAGIPPLKKIYKKMMHIPETRLRGSRGLILCAVFGL
jgi:SAM-dependent methyltransferase